MPRYRIEITREVTETERVYRVVEAIDARHAQLAGNELAGEFDSSCPDDAKAVGPNFGDWGVETVVETEEDVDE